MPDTANEHYSEASDKCCSSIKLFLDRQLQLDEDYGIIDIEDFDLAMYVPIYTKDPKAIPLPDTGCGKRFGMFNYTPGQEHYYQAMACKAWKDPPCARNNKYKLYRRFRYSKVKDWPIKTHAVLTVADQESDKNIARFFNILITYLRRGVYARVLDDDTWVDSKGKPHKKVILVNKKQARKTDRFIYRPHIQYVGVKEFQNERFLNYGLWFRHLHVIFNQHVPIYDLIPIWNHITGVSFNYIFCRSIYNWDNGNYLLKYFTKEEYQAQFEDGERRYFASKGVLEPAKKLCIYPRQFWHFDMLETCRELYYQSKANLQRFDANFDKILYLTKMKERFIRANAADNFIILNY